MESHWRSLKWTIECWIDRLPMPLSNDSNSSPYSFCNRAHLAVARPKQVQLYALIFCLGNSVGNFDCTILFRRKTSKRTSLISRIHNVFEQCAVVNNSGSSFYVIGHMLYERRFLLPVWKWEKFRFFPAILNLLLFSFALFLPFTVHYSPNTTCTF